VPQSVKAMADPDKPPDEAAVTVNPVAAPAGSDL
jgi:hypothetical protein